ncbi:hypothetical protein TD95_003332 [Thielaviopsis punctulata]|uniref:protein-ribulosamine 3-kinase n=1 Tax=Thielaviopsis punctulata TaxID=72032 RepID=A0A0F4ZAC5_9PEZI|nr:hypothetical protein TD95_003332 [Thielaviopsis punctulata]
MAPEAVDPAILESLQLDGTCSTLSRYGSSNFSTSYRLDSVVNGENVIYFVKTGSGPEAEAMFQGEHYSLNAIASIVPTLCPRSLAYGPLRCYPGFFIVTDFMYMDGSIYPSGMTLAQKLATLHTTPAPLPYGGSSPAYGFPVTTCCGSTEQVNDWRYSWSDFFAECRLHAIANQLRSKGCEEPNLCDAIDAIAVKVVPRLLGEQTLKGVYPVVVHGDLWSGNCGQGILHGQAEEVVFDPAGLYAHSEYDLGIMKMFGGVGADFWQEYHQIVPKHEPQEEYEDRIQLYKLYHYLNHYLMFGGSYLETAFHIIEDLAEKYVVD